MTTEEIIANFFEGKCDARDIAIVQALLKENPDILKEYIAAEEWENFQPAHDLERDISGKLWNGIHKNTAAPEAHYSHFRWMAVAASILLVIGLSWNFIFEKHSTAIAVKATPVFNNTPQKMTLSLDDGSTVELSPNSTLSYPKSLNAEKREIILNGEANFNVAKDPARPFSVYSNTVLITVLGTRFTVNDTKVILRDGRVMVNVPHSTSQYYLIPGDVFIFKNATPRILHLEKDKDDCYVFDDYPLDVVFDQLQIIYNAKIVYNKAALGNRSFIGKIDKKDSLKHILKSIALLNNFGLREQGDSTIITN